MFFSFPPNARWEAEHHCVVFGVGIGEYEGVVRVPRRVFQTLLDQSPTPERCLEAYHLHRTRLELIAERKVRRRQLTDDDYTALAKTYPTPPASAGIVFGGDEGRLSEEAFLRDFAGDLPDAKAKALYAVQWPFHKALLAGKTTHAAWRSKPSYYAVSTEDRTINPELERFMAKRMGAKTIEVKASHLSLISHPEEITRLILEAAGH